MDKTRSTREILAATADVKASELAELEQQAEFLRQEIAALESALERLPGAPLAVVSSPSTPKGRRTLQDRIRDLIARSPDHTVTSSAIRLATGAPSHLIAAALRALVIQGVLRDTGIQGPRMAGRGKAPRVYRAA